MKECDKRNSHISSKLHMIYISSNLVDALLLRPSLLFTTLHPITTLHPHAAGISRPAVQLSASQILFVLLGNV